MQKHLEGIHTLTVNLTAYQVVKHLSSNITIIRPDTNVTKRG